ncbi:hypothetical protein Sjap_006374 [Stephania japonica]|uniref:Uncharacterized protein n=1 Tax=Stephania japonica TaxID=461633 RepID=A0AAP0PMR0_9MAGN
MRKCKSNQNNKRLFTQFGPRLTSAGSRLGIKSTKIKDLQIYATLEPVIPH